MSALRGRRRGIVLAVVLALLTLFALIGISFDFYTDARGSTPGVARALAEIRLAEMALDDLIANPDDPALRRAAATGVHRALDASSDAAGEVAAARLPETRRLPGLLKAAGSLARVLKKLLGVPDC